MKYLKTKHEKNSAKITTLIVIILVLLCFVIGQNYQDPPEEYGVAINFGNSAVGSGNIQPSKPVKSKNVDINKNSQEAQKEPNKAEENQKENQQSASSSSSEEKKENILTQNTEEAIAIKKAEAKAKALAIKKAKAKAAAKAKKKAEEAKKKAEIDALMGGINNTKGEVSGSEGNDGKTGDKGQLNGNPYAPSYFGGGKGKGGVGSGLNGRGQGRFNKIKQTCNQTGLVVVKVEVDRNGNVVKATPGVKGTENTAACLLEPAKKIAESGKWPADPKAPARQIGFVSIDFKLGQ